MLAVGAVLLLALPSVATALVIVIPPIPEQLVEGHTVFATIEVIREQSTQVEFAAAVAVLVRDRLTTISVDRFPGVLWFNDQFLTNPTVSRSSNTRERFPCTGAVIAVNRGDLIVDQDLLGQWTLVGPTYVESYFITDPNERTWIVDLWNTVYDRPAWTVAILNSQTGYGVPDNGSSNCAAFNDDVTCTPTDIHPAIRQQCGPGAGRVDHKSPGDHGIGYPCQGCSAIRYNAVLYFRLDHLDQPGAPKNHTERTGDDWRNDAAGCHASATNSWRCPAADDDREGNSHPYNPDLPFLPADGRGNHGGSEPCDGVWELCHATRNIDLYFGYVTPPPARTFYVLDLAGADAPFHCHDDQLACEPGDSEAAVERRFGGIP